MQFLIFLVVGIIGNIKSLMNDYHSLGLFVEAKPFRHNSVVPPSLSGTAFKLGRLP